MKRIPLIYFHFLLFCLIYDARGQGLVCEKTFGWTGQDQIISVVEVGGGYLSTAFSDTISVALPGFPNAKLRKLLIIRFTNNCDTLWTKTFDTIGYGGLNRIVAVGDNRFLVGGHLIDPSTYTNPPQIIRPFIMFVDSMGNALGHAVFFQFMGSVTGFVHLADKGFMVSIYRQLYALSGEARSVAVRIDSAGQVVWAKTLMENLAPTESQTPNDLIQTNDGCFLLTASETNSSNITRPRLIKFNLDGDTLWTKRMELPGVTGNTFIYSQASNFYSTLILSNGYHFPSPFGTSGIISKLSNTFNEVSRHERFGGITRIEIMGNGKITTPIFSTASTNNYNSRIAFLDTNLNYIDTTFSYTTGSNFIAPNIYFLNQNSEIVISGYRTEPGITQGQDFYFARYSNPHGPRYEHDYCGQNLPTASFFATTTQDSLFVHNISLSGLDCIPTLSHLEWNSYSQFFNSNAPGLAFAKAGLPDTLDLELIATNYFGCRDTLRAHLAVQNGDIIYSVRETKEEPARLSVFPNPAKDKVSIRYEGHSPHWSFDRQAVVYPELTLYDIHGRTVHTALLKEPTTEMDISGLPAGMYFYRAVIGERMKTGKLVVE